MLCIFGVQFGFAQSEEEILAEAYRLYYSEKASWHGTDLFLENFSHKREEIKGYFSYSTNQEHHCIFYDK
ncbi:MAG: hypothetical protein AAFU64_03705, partial [Bacteroidota bacterium]